MPQDRETAILVGLDLKGSKGARGADHLDYTAEESIDELAALAISAGAVVEDQVLQSRERAEAATLIGSGKVAELAGRARAGGIGLVVFDQELTPTQYRNLERALDTRVVDRTQLILDIFARRARSREGQLQVELAQLNYLLPRLTGRGVEMSRLGGGIGTRGPGETQLETDRRRIYRRLRKIQEELEGVRSSRSTQRRQRQAVPLASVALVGYTNAGKSTLFNRLTGASVLVDARMFATLDPTVRVVTLPSRRRILVSDTVGFIRALPTTLVKAFRATLEEVTESSLLLHVVDVTSAHATRQIAHVLKVLDEIGAGTTNQLLVLNKLDLLSIRGEDPDAARRRLAAQAGIDSDHAVAVSARTGDGVERILGLLDRVLPIDPIMAATFRFPLAEAGKVHQLHQWGRVTATRYVDEYCEVDAEVPESVWRRLEDYATTAVSLSNTDTATR